VGASFKPNVRDVRNSKPVELAKLLIKENIEVDIIDPLVDAKHLEHASGILLTDQPNGSYHVVVIAVNHTVYKELGESYFCDCTFSTSLIIDLTGAFKDVIRNRKYWTI
jgi:UDP-N-acetyl-D-mannosaminuronate dehydrogenase